MIKQDYKSSSSRRLFQLKDKAKAYQFHWGEALAVGFGVLLLTLALSSSNDDESQESITGQIQLTELNATNSSATTNANEPQSAETKSQIKSTPSFSADPKTQDFQTSQARLPLNIEWQVTPEVTESTISQPKPQIAISSVTIKSGDTLSSIFQKQGLSARDVYRVTQDSQAAEFLRKIRPGKTLEFTKSSEGELIKLSYPLSINETLIVNQRDDKYVSTITSKQIEVREAFAYGIINNSLFVAGKEAGLSDNMVMSLAEIFGYDIDFALDIRPSDSFAMVYEKRYLDGEYIGDGKILTAQFVNQGDIFQAVRYTDTRGNEDYFTPSGDSMRKAFLRNPVNFRYITSNFNPRRFHPILKRVKPHRGIDYSAKTGTPVYAAGDGKVIASSYNKYNGKFVFIQHGNNIVTKYLHLSKRNVSRGKRVKQGQVIGLVGSTGMSQAPHLHYEFVVNGVHRNPRTVNLPKAEPIHKKEIERFKQQTHGLIANLETRKRNLSQSISGSR